MPGIVFPQTIGKLHGFQSIAARFGLLRFTGFKSINYSRNRDRGMQYGTHPDPLGKTSGKNNYKADCEIILVEWQLFQASLGPGYGDVPFLVTVEHSEIGMPTIVDVLLGCTVDSTEASHSEGTDATVRKVDLNPVKILFGGQDDRLISLALASAA